MTKFLENSLLAAKILVLSIAVFFFVLFFRFPSFVGLHAQRVTEELRKFDQQVEVSFFGVKFTADSTRADDLQVSEQIVLKQRAILASIDCNTGCSDELEKQTDAIKSQNEIQIGASAKIALNDAWVVIAASFQTIEGAMELETKLSENGLNSGIVLGASRYRPFAVFSSQDAAKAGLEKVSLAVSRDDPYVRLLVSWCSDHKVIIENDTEILSCDRTAQLASKN